MINIHIRGIYRFSGLASLAEKAVNANLSEKEKVAALKQKYLNFTEAIKK